MIQGGSAEGFPKAVEWATHHPKAFEALLEKISFALRQLIEMQMQAGVDALQIFDSWHSLCPKEKAWDWSLKWIKEIVENLSDPCPVLLYAKSSKERLKTLCQSGVSGLSLDHGIHLRDARSMLPALLSCKETWILPSWRRTRNSFEPKRCESSIRCGRIRIF